MLIRKEKTRWVASTKQNSSLNNSKRLPKKETPPSTYKIEATTRTSQVFYSIHKYLCTSFFELYNIMQILMYNIGYLPITSKLLDQRNVNIAVIDHVKITN
jgi:hypothetical protein